MAVDARHHIEFDGYSIDLRTRVLSQFGREIALRPKSFDVLACLVQNAGTLLSKDKIISSVWPNVIASDESLSRCVSDIRAALDDTQRRIIRTVPGRGYIFSADINVSPIVDRPRASRFARGFEWPPGNLRSPLVILSFLAAIALFSAVGLFAPSNDSGSPISDRPSIAVLPFENLSDDPGQSYFADGMAEDIITGLSKLSVLFVASRNSSFQYRDRYIDAKRVGRELGVRYLLDGSVRRVEDKVRITAQLIDTSTGGNLWAEHYDGQLNDVFRLQDKVTGRIVEALSLSLGASEIALLTDHGTTNIEAYDAFLRGQSHAANYTADGAKLAVQYYQQALELDPAYLRAVEALQQIRFIEKFSGLK